jgi:hypothetical protein
LTSALHGREWSASRPGRFTPEERTLQDPLDWGADGPQNQSGRCGDETNHLLRLSWWLIDAESVLGLLHRVVVDDVADVSEAHIAQNLQGKSGGSTYFRNVGNITHNHTV